MTPRGQAPGGAVLSAFAAAVVLGGANFVAVRISNQELDPFWGTSLRFGMAAALFVVIALALRLRLPRGRLLPKPRCSDRWPSASPMR